MTPVGLAHEVSARHQTSTTPGASGAREFSDPAHLYRHTRHLPAMIYRRATADDCPLLAELNHQLIHDEKHRNQMAVPELEQRMKDWLAGEYEAILFEDTGEVVAYALYQEQREEIYLRQLFVVRHRRRQGIGRRAVRILRSEIWPKTERLTVDVLVQNEVALGFWRAMGYRDYCLTLEIMPADTTCA